MEGQAGRVVQAIDWSYEHGGILVQGQPASRPAAGFSLWLRQMKFARILRLEVPKVWSPTMSDAPNPAEPKPDGQSTSDEPSKRLSPEDAQAVIQAINEVERTEAERLPEK